MEHLLFTQYADRMRRMRRKERSIQNWINHITRFEQWLVEFGIDPLKVEHHQIEEYLAGLQVAPSSYRNYLKSIRAPYRYAFEIRQIDRVPTNLVAKPPIPDREPRTLSNEELRQIKRSCWMPRQVLLFHILAYTGMRKTECRTLKWEQIDLETATIKVIGKGDKMRKIPVHPALAEVLAGLRTRPEWPVFPATNGPRRGLGDPAFHHAVAQIAPEARTHDFRRTVTSSLALNKVSPHVIDKWMGWGSKAIRDRYYIRVADTELREASLALYSDDPL